jgi:SRSO17 transposase
MKDTQIFNIIKSVFPKADFYESEDYLLENNMIQVDRKTNICWMPQDESLTSDIYQSDSYFTLSIEMDDGFLCSIHPNLVDVIAKIKSSHK